MRSIAIALTVLLVLAGAAPVPVAAQSEAYSGTHVSFGTESDAVVNYAVGGTTVAESLQVQSTSEAESGGGIQVGAGLETVTGVGGSAISLDSSTDLRASLTTESGAAITTYDNERGVLVVDAGGESQYVTANLSGGASAESDGDSRVVVTAEDGTEGTYVVVGDGEVTVNEEGDVAARLGNDGKLVFRAYQDGRSDHDAEQEDLIADGTAAAEVYVTESAEGSGEFAADVVSYSEDTTVEVTERSEGTIRMTAERSASEGKVILTSVSESAMDAGEDLQVTVDGEAAARAESYGELRSAANGGDQSAFLVHQDASAEASADVLVSVNHFSEREVEISENGGGGSGGDGGPGDGGNGDESSSPGRPGFGVGISVVALLAAALMGRAHGR